MNHPRSIHIEDFSYDLPAEKIAYHPVSQRDCSKLLIYKEGQITEDIFKNIAHYFPANSRVVFNETKVFQARLPFRKASGAAIELFCLEPVAPHTDIERAFAQRESCIWRCMAGNVKKWKSGKIGWTGNENSDLQLFAELIEREEETFLIRFSWNPATASFSEVVEHCGNMPLPPYIRRREESGDKTSYQTIYAREEGSVAAPTAGLHFTEEVLKTLQVKDIELLKVTLHTGAGTFKPVSSETLAGHVMHTEKMQISKQTIQQLCQTPQGVRVAVGTTTVRTLESLYWFGVKLLLHPETTEFFIDQWEVYDELAKSDITVNQSLEAVLDFMTRNNMTQLYGATKLIITPTNYRIRMADALITNFHQPQSTLLLLVAAFIGDAWKDAYQYALSHNFRFLSYGDACLFEMCEKSHY